MKIKVLFEDGKENTFEDVYSVTDCNPNSKESAIATKPLGWLD